MTSSSEHRTPQTLKLNDEHWHALTATLSPESTDQFDQWMDERLHQLEEHLVEFASHRSICKNLRG